MYVTGRFASICGCKNPNHQWTMRDEVLTGFHRKNTAGKGPSSMTKHLHQKREFATDEFELLSFFGWNLLLTKTNAFLFTWICWRCQVFSTRANYHVIIIYIYMIIQNNIRYWYAFLQPFFMYLGVVPYYGQSPFKRIPSNRLRKFRRFRLKVVSMFGSMALLGKTGWVVWMFLFGASGKRSGSMW